VRAIGLGSPAARLTAFNEFMQLLPRFDELGQVNAIRDRVAARVGYDQVDRYLPNPNVKNRVPVDAKIAELENGSMQAGKMVTVMPNENHAIHLGVHLRETQPLVQATQTNQVQDKQGTMMYLTMIYEHCNDHLTRIAGDKTKQAEISQANLAMNLLREAVVNLQRDVEQDIRAAAEAQQQAAMEQGAVQPISPQMQMKMQEHQLDMQLKQEKAAMDAKFKELELKQKLALQDAATAASLRSAFETPNAPTA
jgi:hypothetical protein